MQMISQDYFEGKGGSYEFVTNFSNTKQGLPTHERKLQTLKHITFLGMVFATVAAQ